MVIIVNISKCLRISISLDTRKGKNNIAAGTSASLEFIRPSSLEGVVTTGSEEFRSALATVVHSAALCIGILLAAGRGARVFTSHGITGGTLI